MIRRPALAVAVLVMVLGACGSSGGGRTAGRPASSTSTTTTTVLAAGAAPCAAPIAAPKRYDSVVVFSFENRTWDEVGPGFGPAMPYLHTLGTQCGWFPQWTETDREQNSLTQYVGQVTGARQATTVDDCKPSASCHTTADSLFRQVRVSGRDAVNYVEGATKPCSAEGNAAKHVPALYLWGGDDRAHCDQQVRPLTDLDPNRLPAFAWVTPDLCHDGHDCGNDVVDQWAREHIQPVLASPAYRAGKVAVFVWYDESSPVPNLWLAPAATAGPHPGVEADAAGTLKAWQSMLGVPCLADACSATDLRAPAHA
jgi:phosphatidylinositol-3-phosphatase